MISNFRVKTITPKFDSKYKHLFEGVHMLNVVVSMDITGVNEAIMSAIRRTCMDECPTKALTIEGEDCIIDGAPHLQRNIMNNQIRAIPLKQDVPDDMTFSLDVKNTTNELMRVHTSDIKAKSGDRWFNKNIVLFTIPPASRVTVKNIRVESGIGRAGGWWASSFAGRFKSTDVPDNVSSTMADPHDFRFRFENNGTMDPIAIMKLTLDILLKRIGTIDNPSVVDSHGHKHTMTYYQESHTLACIIVYYLVHGGVESIGFKVDEASDTVNITFVDEGDALETLKKKVRDPAEKLVQRLMSSLSGVKSKQTSGTIKIKNANPEWETVDQWYSDTQKNLEKAQKMMRSEE